MESTTSLLQHLPPATPECAWKLFYLPQQYSCVQPAGMALRGSGLSTIQRSQWPGWPPISRRERQQSMPADYRPRAVISLWCCKLCSLGRDLVATSHHLPQIELPTGCSLYSPVHYMHQYTVKDAASATGHIRLGDQYMREWCV